MPRRSIPKPHYLLPLAALCAIVPLLLQGPSCGHDEVFHLQSWLDAATQLRAGTLLPHWATSPAWNAGEPRFLFYPPLSWLLGELLTFLAPIQAVPVLFIAIALTTSGLNFYHFARNLFDAPRQISPHAAALAAALYLANPYMLFNAYERSAFAELLAAAWLPLLLLAVLRKRPTAPGLALPIALLWLTNAPAAVMGCYTLALLATLRVLFTLPHFLSSRRDLQLAGTQLSPTTLALTYLAGTALGLALPAFYLLPAAYEQRYVQVAMAIIPNMRFQDNFLFSHNAFEAHNLVTHQVSIIALTLLLTTTATLSALLLSKEPQSRSHLSFLLATLTFLIALLLVPISTPIWNHLPKLAFLQFPWRLLSILAPITALTLALLFNRTKPSNLSSILYPLSSALLLSLLGTRHFYGQHCEVNDTPRSVANLFHTHHGAGPTDEYTPASADNDILRTDNPAYWLAARPNDPAPNTVPTPAELNPNLQSDDAPIPLEQTVSAQAPHHLDITLTRPAVLVLNLRDFPAWRISLYHAQQLAAYNAPRISRDDGLVAIALPSGPSTLDIAWYPTEAERLGQFLTLLALLVFVATVRKQGIGTPKP